MSRKTAIQRILAMFARSRNPRRDSGLLRRLFLALLLAIGITGVGLGFLHLGSRWADLLDVVGGLALAGWALERLDRDGGVW